MKKVKLKVPDKFRHATEVLGVAMPDKGGVIEVDENKAHRFLRIGFTKETKEAKEAKGTA